MLEFTPMLAPGVTLFVPYILIPFGLCNRTAARLLMGTGVGIAMMGGGLMIMRMKCGHVQTVQVAEDQKPDSMGTMLRQVFGASLMSSGFVFVMTCSARGVGVSRDRAILVSGMSFGAALVAVAALRLMGWRRLASHRARGRVRRQLCHRAEAARRRWDEEVRRMCLRRLQLRAADCVRRTQALS